MSSISDDKVVVLIGKRETGKSFLVKDLLYHHRDMPVGTVISPTESANKFFGHIVPPLFVHEEYTAGVLENVIKRQKLVQKSIDQQTSLYGTCNIDPRVFVILDDCLADNCWVKDKNIRTLFMNGRHFHAFFVITMQYPLGIPPALRTNIDYVFVLRENLVSNRKRIYENYAGMFPTFDVFCQVMDQCTEDFECLVINNNAKSNRIEDQVFWYKADSHPNFRLGAQQFWTLSQEFAQQKAHDDDDDDVFDAAALGKGRRGPLVNVKKALAGGRGM